MLQPVRRRTWAPRGQTPYQRAWDRHDRLSVLGAICLSPLRHRMAHYFRLQSRNVKAEDLVSFAKQLHGRLRRHIIITWDRSRPHRAAAKQLLREHSDWFTIEWLPAYAPELNPEEQCWNHTKYSDLANYIPEDIGKLQEAISDAIARQHNNQPLLRSFFEYTKLPL